MKKHSPFTPFIAHAIKKMTEAGIKNVLWKRHIESEPNCKPIRAKGTPLGMEKFSSLFVLYSIGCLMSLIIPYGLKSIESSLEILLFRYLG